MFEDTSPELAALDEVALTLEFEEAGRRTVEAEVIEPGSVVHPEGQR
jgi:copper(I)-binding protein